MTRIVTVVLVTVALSASLIEASVYYVSPNGSDANPGTKSLPFATIDFAVDRAQHGDTVFVTEGRYVENVSITSLKTDRSGSEDYLTVAALPGHEVVIDGARRRLRRWDGLVRVEGVARVKLLGLRVTNSRRYGIKIRRAASIIVSESEISNTRYGALVVEDSVDVTLSSNEVYRSNRAGRRAPHEAITLSKVDGFEVAGNHVHDNVEEGIDAKDGSRNGAIHHNVVHGNGAVGIYVDGATNVDVYNNTVYDNATAGLALGVERREDTRAIRIFNNVVYGNGDGGLQFYSETDRGVTDCQIVNNTFHANEDAGVWFLGSQLHSSNLIRNNIFADNGYKEIRDDVGTRVGLQSIDSNLFTPDAGSDAFGLAPVIGEPEFVDPAAHDYRLGPASSAVDVAEPSEAPSFDIDGTSRPQGAGYDIGAYERQDDGIPEIPNEPPRIESVLATPGRILDTETTQLEVHATDPDGGPAPLTYGWTIEIGVGSLSDATAARPVLTPGQVTGGQTLLLRVVVSDGEDSATQTVEVEVVESEGPPEEEPENVFYVAMHGDNANPGTLDAPWRDIDFAVDGVRPGDTVVVLEGTYAEKLTLTSSSGTEGGYITLRAQSGHDVLVDGSSLVVERPWNALIRIEGVSHIRIVGMKFKSSSNYGFKIRQSSSIVLEDNEVYLTDHGGVVVEESSDIRIVRNQVHQTNQIGRSANHEAITLSNVDGFEVAHNHSHDNVEEGIDAKDGSRNGAVHHNVVHGNGAVGIYVDGATNVDVYNNTVYDNATAGLSLGVERSEDTRAIRIFNNVVYGNGDGGLQFYSETDRGVTDCQIVNNTFHSNEDAGVWFLGSQLHSGNLIRNNIFADNGYKEIRDDVGTRVGLQSIDSNLFTPDAGSDAFGLAPVIGEPEFVDPTAHDYRLGPASSAVDVAEPSEAPSFDIDGTSRPQGAGYDIGAYELRNK